LMVIGLVEPYDGFDLKRLDPKNPPPAPWTVQPNNPELLQALAEDFRDHNYSIHRVIKNIMKSSAYQLSTQFEGEWKGAYIPYYARRYVRVLSGPEAVDLVAQATDSPFTFRLFGQPRNYVKELTNPISVRGPGEGSAVYAFMQTYYQSERAMPPVDKNVASPVQAMMMMTSPVVIKRISGDGNTRVAKLLNSGKSDDAIIEELFLSSVSRRPSTEEVEVAKRVIAQNRKTGLGDLEWALLNTTEFLVNH
jgi:Protein of unknown function (DUF1553)